VLSPVSRGDCSTPVRVSVAALGSSGGESLVPVISPTKRQTSVLRV